MDEHALNLSHDETDDLLDRAIQAVLSEPVPSDVRGRTIDTAAAWIPMPLRRLRLDFWRRRSALAAAAALLLISVSVGICLFVSNDRAPKIAPAEDSAQSDDASDRNTGTSLPSFAGLIRSNTRAAVAENAPVIVANGGMKPIHLGEFVPYREAGSFLHVWDWSKSPMSRVLPRTHLGEKNRIAISPDGQRLVWAKGDILDLETGTRSKIDLGGASHSVTGEEAIRRIRDMRFSPDGNRLALLVSHYKFEQANHPLRREDLTKTEVVQIVEFPSGKLLCEFPAGESHRLRIGLTADGSRVFSGMPPGKRYRQVVQRETATGDLLRQYEPRSNSQLLAICVSPDETHVAACEYDGDVFIWKADSGDLIHHIAEPPFKGPWDECARFSPDGKYLAVHSGTLRIHIIEVATGKIVNTVRQSTARDIHWSADSKTFTAVTPFSHGERNDKVHLYNVYPAVHEWDWPNAKRIRSLTSRPLGSDDIPFVDE